MAEVATARQPVRGPDSVVPLCQVECGAAVALQRRVPHNGSLLGAVQSASLVNAGPRLEVSVNT